MHAVDTPNDPTYLDRRIAELRAEKERLEENPGPERVEELLSEVEKLQSELVRACTGDVNPN